MHHRLWAAGGNRKSLHHRLWAADGNRKSLHHRATGSRPRREQEISASWATGSRREQEISASHRLRAVGGNRKSLHNRKSPGCSRGQKLPQHGPPGSSLLIAPHGEIVVRRVTRIHVPVSRGVRSGQRPHLQLAIIDKNEPASACTILGVSGLPGSSMVLLPCQDGQDAGCLAKMSKISLPIQDYIDQS